MIRVLAATVFFLGASTTPAFAADGPEISITADGTVVGRMLIDAPENEIKALIPELQRATSNKNVYETQMSRDGSCQSIFRRTRGLMSPLELRTRLCPTVTGWREVLVKSDDYSAYNVEWTVLESNGASEVQIRVQSDVNLMVPKSMVQSGTVAGVRLSFADLLKRMLSGKSTP